MLKLYTICFLLSFSFINFCHGQSNVGESVSGFLTSKSPMAPSPITPSNWSENVLSPCIMVWNSQIHTSAFSLHVSEDPDFSELMLNKANLADTTFLVTGLSSQTNYYWRVKATNVAGESNFSPVMAFTTANTTEVENTISASYSCWLQPPYPNPFSENITIAYILAEQAKLTITVFNNMGQAVRELVSETKEPGEYTESWDGSDNLGIALPGGLYICVLSTNDVIVTQTFILNK